MPKLSRPTLAPNKTERNRLPIPRRIAAIATFATFVIVALATLPVSVATAQKRSGKSEASPANSPSPRDEAGGDAQITDPQITEILTKTLEETGLPALFAARYREGEPLRVAAVGVRRFKSRKAVTVDDLVHIGSCTKAMTATLIGHLVDQKNLEWDSTIAEILPRLAAKIHPDYGPVTIEQLLTHRGGFPANPPNWWMKKGDSITEFRRNIAIAGLTKKPAHPPGSKFLYSNLGYMTAGLMATQVTGQEWETTIREQLFIPLKMKSAGFGPPGTEKKLDQPWGHLLSGKLTIPRQGDNAPALGPAGTVHLSLADWARFGAVHLGTQPNRVVSPETLERLHRVPPKTRSSYALGWGVWAKGRAFVHAGSNTMWMAKIKVVPETGTVYLAVCNAGSGPDIDRWIQKVMTEIEALDDPEKDAAEQK